MPKELLVMRHAKSSWDDPGLSDHDRILNKRGLRDAPRMAGWLNEQNLVPDLIICSSAVRAHSTAKIVCENLNGSELLVEVVEEFYLAPPDTYLEYLQRLSDQYDRVLVIGHNPGLEALVNQYSNTWESMPTSAIAVFELGIEKWSDLPVAKSTLIGVYRPKELEQS